MKARVLALLALCCVFVFVLSFPAADESKSQVSKTLAFTGLSPGEQELLDEINQARANPQAYASHLEKLKPMFSGKEFKTATLAVTTAEGWTAVQEAIAFLRTAKPVGALSTSKGLSLAAMWHAREQSGSGATGHRSGNGGGYIEDRAKSFGAWQGGIGENLSYGNESPRERLITWLIDDGFASRGHRKKIMSSEYKVAGISCGPHPQFGAMCVLTFAGAFMDAPSAPAVNKTAVTPANSKTPKITKPAPAKPKKS